MRMRPPEWTNDRHRRATTQAGWPSFVRLRSPAPTPCPAQGKGPGHCPLTGRIRGWPAQAAKERDDLQAGQAGIRLKAGVFVFQLRRSPKEGWPESGRSMAEKSLSEPSRKPPGLRFGPGRLLAGPGRPVFAAPAGRCGRGPVSSLERMAISVYARALSGGGRCSSRFCALLQLKLVLHDYGSGTFRSTA